jgi:hypothetical protein
VLSMAAGRGGSPIQWGAASPAEAIRAEPAKVAAAHAGLCRSTDAIDGLRCRARVPLRAEAGVPLRAEAGAPVRAEAWVLVPAEVRVLVQAKAGVPVRAEDRDGLRCRADTRDTYWPSIGRGFALGCHPDAGPGLSCGQWRADAARFRATGSPAEVLVTHAGCCG